MANPSLQIGNSNWAIKEDDLLGYSKAGTRFVPEPITMTSALIVQPGSAEFNFCTKSICVMTFPLKELACCQLNGYCPI